MTGCGKPDVVGLHPEYPPVVRKSFTLRADFVTVDTLMPTLRWQPLEIKSEDQSTEKEKGRIENVTYELRIWRTVPTESGKLVYVRRNITSTMHRLETPLEPGTRYLWSIRAHFDINGRNRLTEWTMAGYVLRNESVPNDSCLRFQTAPSP
jgi:hypothetical protein